jgi:hypothetical protein
MAAKQFAEKTAAFMIAGFPGRIMMINLVKQDIICKKSFLQMLEMSIG